MKQVLAFPLALLIATPDGAHALGLGDLERKSALNQPFNATIELIGPQADEIDNLSVRLADLDRFQHAGIERAAVLSQLHFEVVQTPHGSDYIKITSPEAIKEPFLDFLLEVKWATGRIFREYTVLLDPPNYANRNGLATERPNLADRPLKHLPHVTGRSDTEVQWPDHATPQARNADQYGPVRANEGLWGIARKVRPDRHLTVQQMMLALLKANPDAFVDGNINALKKGSILHIPSTDEISRTSQTEALSEIRRQLDVWRRGRVSGSDAPRHRSRDLAPQARSGQTSGAQDTEGELHVVTPSNDSKPAAGSTENKGAAPAIEAKPAPKDLTLTQEALESQRLENTDLKSKLTESDETVRLLQQQISLKNAELAALQTKLGNGASGAAAKPVTPAASEQPAHAQQSGGADPAQATSAPSSLSPTQATSANATIESRTPTKVAAPTPAASVKANENSSSGGSMDIFEVVPGGIFTVAGTLLALAAGALFAWKRRKPADDEFIDSDVSDDISLPGSTATVSAPLSDRAKVDKTLDKTQPEPRIESVETRPSAEDAPAKPKVRSSTQQVSFENDTTLGLSGDLREDPLAEVNVYLAYEQFEQAEALVQEAIRTHPQDVGFKMRLLEVYYSSGNTRAYENFAKVVRDATGGVGSVWDDVLAMWQEMSPTRALFDVSGNVVPQPSTANANTFVDLTDLASAEELGEPRSSANDSEQDNLDFDLSVVDLSAATEPNEAAEVLDLTSVLSHGDVGLDLVDLSDDRSSADDGAGFIDLSGEMSSVESIGDMLDISGGVDPLERTQDDARPVRSGTETLDFSFDLETANLENSLLDVTSNSVIDPSIHGDVLDVTGTSAGFSVNDGDGRTTQPLSDVVDGVSRYELTGDPGSIDIPIADTTDLAAIKERTSATRELPDLDFVPGTLGFDQDLTPAESTLTNMHVVPDIDFSLSTGAIIGKPGAEAANHDLRSIDDEQKPFEQITWSFDETGEDEAALHLNKEGSSSELELRLEQDPSAPASDFLDIFGSDAAPIESMTHAGADELAAMDISPEAEQRQADEVDAKLSLAKTYLELGDIDGASSMLDEIDLEGSSKQKAEAAKLRQRISG